jgi:hypothetical protein
VVLAVVDWVVLAVVDCVVLADVVRDDQDDVAEVD